MGLFQRHVRLRREVTLVDCNGKRNIPAFQRMLNAFGIPYRVVHDGDTNNPQAFADNAPIAAALPAGGAHLIHKVLPDDLEGLLGIRPPREAASPTSRFAPWKTCTRRRNCRRLSSKQCA